MRLVRVMCSGRVDMAFVLRAFANGMDGVFIVGCRLNECNYITHGNYNALNMVSLCRRIMAHAGVNPDRLGIRFMSAADGILFADTNDEFVRQIKALGPLGQSEGIDTQDLKTGLEKARKLIPYIKVMKREKLALHLDSEEAYQELYSREEVDSLLDEPVSYYIDPGKCRACMICARRCPVEAISGGKNRIHVIDQQKCIKCGTCFAACPDRFGAVEKISGAPVPPPVPEAERQIKRKRRQVPAG